MCPYIRTVNSRPVQMQPAGFAGPGGLSLFVRKSKGVNKSAGTSTILAVPSGSVVSMIVMGRQSCVNS